MEKVIIEINGKKTECGFIPGNPPQIILPVLWSVQDNISIEIKGITFEEKP